VTFDGALLDAAQMIDVEPSTSRRGGLHVDR
jgi:hypothetical protein